MGCMKPKFEAWGANFRASLVPFRGARDSKGHHSTHPTKSHVLDAKINRVELRERYKTYLSSHYLSLHITVVSVVLAAAGVAAASLMTRPMGANHELLVLWLLWIGSLAATCAAYGGPMVGAFALPAAIPSISDLLLPLLVGITEFLLFTILVNQVNPAGVNLLVNSWLIIMAIYSLLAEVSILRARHHFLAGLREKVYSRSVAVIVKRYLRGLVRSASGVGMTTALSAAGAGLRVSGTIDWNPSIFPLFITLLLFIGLWGHSRTAIMWRDLLPNESATHEGGRAIDQHEKSAESDPRRDPPDLPTGQMGGGLAGIGWRSAHDGQNAHPVATGVLQPEEVDHPAVRLYGQDARSILLGLVGAATVLGIQQILKRTRKSRGAESKVLS